MASSTPFHPAEVECSGEGEAGQSLDDSGELVVGLAGAATEVC